MSSAGRIDLQTVFLASVVIICVFSGLFLFYANEMTTAGLPMGTGLNNTYSNMSAQLTTIDSSVTDIKEKALALSESKTGGIAGLVVTSVEGFSATIKLMKESLTFGLNSIMVMIDSLGLPIPSWAIAAVFLIMTILIIFAILKAISGRFWI